MENKNKFFNIVSHDLKSPLNSVNVLSTILLEDYNSLNEEEKLQKIRMISKTSRQGKNYSIISSYGYCPKKKSSSQSSDKQI